MRKHFSSLRSQMTLLTTGTVLAATVFYSSAQRMSEKKAATFVHSMLVQLGDSLDRIGNEMSYLGNALHSNEVLQQYYHAPTAIQRMQYGKSFIDFTSSLLNHSQPHRHRQQRPEYPQPDGAEHHCAGHAGFQVSPV